ncbi:aldo/keto reductase [Phycisphaerales bacterium AB-hyl4]|uniref:Aldo/keto reductase n=1 Tax=Natronomicrosphaera hydrolytica TaxID=3242702 RepID=A0ABV4U5P7_9BACT
MKYRTLGSTNLRVSVVGVGTWQYGGEWGMTFTQPDVDAIFDAAREAGINLIDTAECYGDHLSESLTGNAIARDRDKWVLATKFGHKFHEPFKRSEPRSPDDVRQQLEASLKAMKTDYVDLYQYHSWGDDKFFDDDVLAVLNDAKAAGKIRHIGNSIGSNRNAKQVEASQRMGIELIQVVYNRLDRAPEEAGVFDLCREQNLGVLARVPLASGYLSGKYTTASEFPENDVRSRWHKPEDRAAKLTEVQRIAEEELPAGVPMAQWALAWCLKHPAVTCVIPGCKNPEQVHGNAAAADLDLVSDDHPQAATAGRAD